MKFLRADLLFYVTDMSGLENCTAAGEGKDFLVALGIARCGFADEHSAPQHDST
jgi:hypothetical protein